MPEGYSTTPLAKKLGIKEGYTMMLYNHPDHYFRLFVDLPKDLKQEDKIGKENIDFIHIFCVTFDELKRILKEYKMALKKNGILWVSWPKGSSKIKTDLKREVIREYILNIGLVDIKVAAIDSDWSGLKFVYRLKDRK